MYAMKIFTILVLALVFCFPAAVLARRDTGPPEWTFDDVAELDDWQDSSNLDPISDIQIVRDSRGAERSVIKIKSMGDDPYIYPGGSPPSWEPFDGYEYGTIYVGGDHRRSTPMLKCAVSAGLGNEAARFIQGGFLVQKNRCGLNCRSFEFEIIIVHIHLRPKYDALRQR